MHVVLAPCGSSLETEACRKTCWVESMKRVGGRQRHSQEFVRALLEQEEPLTFASSATPVSSPVQILSRHEGVSPDNLR